MGKKLTTKHMGDRHGEETHNQTYIIQAVECLYLFFSKDSSDVSNHLSYLMIFDVLTYAKKEMIKK